MTIIGFLLLAFWIYILIDTAKMVSERLDSQE